MDNQHKKISGYRDLSQNKIDLMNRVKAQEKVIADLFKEVMAHPESDKRSAALGRTNLEQGFMWLVRAVAKPVTLFEG